MCRRNQIRHELRESVEMFHLPIQRRTLRFRRRRRGENGQGVGLWVMTNGQRRFRYS